MKGFSVIVIAILCIIYLINPTMGFIEFIPDIVPFIGNLDEVTATAILLACGRYFGYDFSQFLGRRNKNDRDDSDIVDIK